MSVDPTAPSNPADPAPQAPSEVAQGPGPSGTSPAGAAASPSAEKPQGTAGEDQTAKPRVRIGTQRPGVAVPRVEPRAKVVFRTQPTEGAMAAETKPESTGAPRSAAEEASAAPVAPAAQPSRPKQAKPRNPKFEIPPAPGAKVERPNLRAGLPPELEAELEAALGDRPLEELIAAEAPVAAAALETLESETRLQGRVARIFRDDVFVDLGGRNQGVLALHQFAKEPAIGDALDVVVTKFNSEDGLYELTPVGASVDIGDWSDIAEGIIVEAQITGHNKGGLECEVNKIRGFIPAGQISNYRVENFEEFVGQRWQCVVVEANRERRNLVLSRRAILEREQAEAKQKLLTSLQVGDVREGTVRTLRDFGAFVDLGGIDGLIHVSQMSWDRVKHPSDVLQLGQKVKVKIQKIDPETHKISLAYRDLFENPWDKAASKYPVTSTVKGLVSKIMDFGAFVKLEPGIEGLVHISELSHKRVLRATEIVQEGQEIEAKVLSVDTENQRISLSMKALEARPEPKRKPGEAAEEAAAPAQEAPKKKPRKVPLQGGLGKSTFGEQFGLKW
jgi:predicted RNA-binding protein with RPS1 domain